MGSSPRGCRVGHDLRTKEQRRSRGVWERQASTQAVASMTTVLGLETAPHRGLVLSAAPGAREPGGGCPPCSAGWEQRPRRGPLWPRWGPGTGAGSSAAIPAPWKTLSWTPPRAQGASGHAHGCSRGLRADRSGEEQEQESPHRLRWRGSGEPCAPQRRSYPRRQGSLPGEDLRARGFSRGEN